MPELLNRQYLQKELEELQQQYELVSENIRSLQEDYYNTDETHKRLYLERKLEKEKKRRVEIETQLTAISARIDLLNQDQAASEKVKQYVQHLEDTLLVEELQEKLKQREKKIRTLEETLQARHAQIEELQALVKRHESRIREFEGKCDFFEQHQEGEVLEGIIQGIHPQHGIFVELAPGVAGLARRADLDKNYARLFSEKEKIKVELKRLNKQERKIDLFIKTKRVPWVAPGKKHRR